MTGGADKSVLKRMVGGRVNPAAHNTMTPSKALRNALARAGDDKLDIPVGMLGMDETRGPPDEVTSNLPDPSLILRLNGPNETIGLAVACPQFLAAVIEVKTLGMVLEGAAPERKATRTDARLVGGFLNHFLGKFATYAQSCPEIPPVQGFSCGIVLPDARSGMMALADDPHICYNINVDFSGGTKTGKLRLVFPTVGVVKVKDDPAKAVWRDTMEKAVLGSNPPLEAILCRMRLPLSDLTGLRPGDMLTLADASLDDVSIVSADHKKIVTAQLGRSGPVRAVRIFIAGDPPKRSPPPEDMSPLNMDSGGGMGSMSGAGAPAFSASPEPALSMEQPALTFEPPSVEPSEMPSFDPPAMDPPDIPAFEPPAPEEGGFQLPEGGFSMNQMENS